tara:strand:+ start:649 stop:987 length:339 start_codon:yes stop_codon:yes gene_type:complete
VRQLFFIAGILTFISGCASAVQSSYCSFDQNEKIVVKNLLLEIANEKSDEVIFYKLPDMFLSESKTFADFSGCRFILSPESRNPEKGVLDGEILVVLDRDTLAVNKVSEISW